MLSDAKLKNLRPQVRMFKIADRDGLYVAVLPSGKISFRFNYRVNGRQETIVLGLYGTQGMSLKEARERLQEARKSLSSGVSPARKKARDRVKSVSAETFGQWTELWLQAHKMSDSTRDMRRSVYERDLSKPFGRLKMWEITHVDLRILCDAIVGRGAPATAVHAREIVMMVYRYANDRGNNYENPGDKVRPHTIATFAPKDRSLSTDEIRLTYEYLERVGTTPIIRMAVKLLLLTMLRKSELTEAEWSEVNFSDALMTIPGPRMKRRNPHNVYLSRQALDMLVALRTCAGGSPYIFPSRYDPHAPMSSATLNRVLTLLCETAREDGQVIANFSPHDLRRTASTHLNEAGYNTDWIEKCLAHEQKGVRAVYNKAEYAAQRRAMLQDWADMIERWVAGR